MVRLTQDIIDLIFRPESFKVMSTVGEDGNPHTVVCGTLMVPDASTLAVGRVYLRNTGKNLERDPRAEFLVTYGKEAYSILCHYRGECEDEDIIKRINQGLNRMGLMTSTVWLFDVDSVYDEGLTPTSGMCIIP